MLSSFAAVLGTHSLTLTDLFERHYIAYSRIKTGTIIRYRSELRRWDRIVGPVPIHRLRTEHFIVFRDECSRRGLSNSSTEGSIKIVKSLLRYAKDRGWIKSLPIFGKPLPIEEPEPEPATLDELSRLYEAATACGYPGKGLVSPTAWMRAFLVLEYWTGIRGQNLCWDFGWRHVREDSIRFRQSKTGKRHTFPLHPIVTAHLRLVYGMDERRVFAVRSLQRVNTELSRLCEAAGVRRMTTNNIREACFTQWTIAGETAGKLVHGCGLPRVLRRHYLGRLQVLEEAMPRFRWPEVMRLCGGS